MEYIDIFDENNNPTGHIKAGESVIDGAIRELKEELGVEA